MRSSTKGERKGLTVGRDVKQRARIVSAITGRTEGGGLVQTDTHERRAHANNRMKQKRRGLVVHLSLRGDTDMRYITAYYGLTVSIENIRYRRLTRD